MHDETRTKYIETSFKLPVHSNELSKADKTIDKLKIKMKTVVEVEYITDRQFLRLYEDIVRVLDYVGRLSIPYFSIEDELERMYVMRYPHSPELARKLWLDHYEKIHHPYSLLKNRCFKLLEELDEHYFKCNDRNPPNWKY
jgi:hypothetical protein